MRCMCKGPPSELEDIYELREGAFLTCMREPGPEYDPGLNERAKIMHHTEHVKTIRHKGALSFVLWHYEVGPPERILWHIVSIELIDEK